MGGELLRTVEGDKSVKHVYLKFGGGARAREDFYSVQPQNVKIENMVNTYRQTFFVVVRVRTTQGL